MIRESGSSSDGAEHSVRSLPDGRPGDESICAIGDDEQNSRFGLSSMARLASLFRGRPVPVKPGVNESQGERAAPRATHRAPMPWSQQPSLAGGMSFGGHLTGRRERFDKHRLIRSRPGRKSDRGQSPFKKFNALRNLRRSELVPVIAPR